MFNARRRGSADPKVVAAAVFAAVGMGWGLWSMLGPAGAAEPVGGRGPEPVLRPVDGDGRAAEAAYTSTKGDAEGVASRLGTMAGEAAARLPVAAVTSGVGEGGTASRVAGAVAGVVGSLLRGDEDAFVAVLRGLGGVVSAEMETGGPLFRQLAERLRGAEVDLARLDVRPYERRGMRRARDGEDAGLREQVQEIRPAGVFPNASEGMDERAIEVRFPFRPRGEAQERWFGMVLVFDRASGQWQPGAFRVMTRGLEQEGGRP